MEIIKPKVKVSENKVEVEEPKLKVSSIGHDFIEKKSIEGPEMTFKEMPDNSPLLKLNHLELFDDLEKEYAKVKDFDFKKLKINDIEKHIRR